MHAGEGDAGVWFAFGRAALVATATRIDRVRDQTAGDVSVVGAGTALQPTDAVDPPDDRELREARARFRASLAGDDLHAVLAANAELAPGDAEVMAVLAAAASDRSCRDLVAAIHGDGGRGVVTLGLLADITHTIEQLAPLHELSGAGADSGGQGDVDSDGGDGRGSVGRDPARVLAVRRDGPLARACLIGVDAEGPWVDHRVRLHSSVVWALLGDDSRDPDLPADAVVHDRVVDDIGANDTGANDADSNDISATPHDFVVVNGPDRLRRRSVGARRSIGERFVCAEAPTAESQWAALVREATITGCGVIVELPKGRSLDAAGRVCLERATHLAWVLSAPSGPSIDDMPRRRWRDVFAPAADPSDVEWERAFGPGVERTHRLSVDQLHRVARAFQPGDDPQAALDTAVRRLTSGDLEQLTTRRRPTRTWDDVIVSDDRRRLLLGIVDRYRHDHQVYEDWRFEPNPSRGLVALFSGPSGTGKTLAAEIVAGELGLDLFKLDLSSVVSKYIGETERNLDQIFDAASAGNVVLFFDEADSLFGKRSEVKDARDRYANIEVSYLLQRLETYDGLVVMATNFEKNVDEAFLRRIHVRVPFSMPAAGERRRIWERNLPSAAPIGDVDLDWLAERFELSGASIRNAAVQGAFLAALDDEPAIGTEHLVRGVMHELRKVGRLVTPSDFGSYAHLVDE